MYSFVVHLYVSGSRSITSVGEERANLSAVVNLKLCGFCSERFPLPLSTWDGLRYFIVALPEPSISLFWFPSHVIAYNRFSLGAHFYNKKCVGSPFLGCILRSRYCLFVVKFPYNLRKSFNKIKNIAIFNIKNTECDKLSEITII